MSPPAVPPASASELTPPDQAAVERFRTATETLAARALDVAAVRNPAVALAVSGGADSMAMLALAHSAFPGRVIAATVDHGLRKEAADEAELVESVCRCLGVPHATLRLDSPPSGSSIQARARAARYEALTHWAAEHDVYPLLTAHHADDQAETLLMRLNRASGLTGLSGIRPFRFEGECVILRPLLDWRRRELRSIVEATRMPWVEDPSNDDRRHDRTRYREFLSGQSLLSAGALAASAAHIRESEQALAWLAAQSWVDRWSDRHLALQADDLPRELQRRLVRRALATVREINQVVLPYYSNSTNIEALLDSLDAGRAATQAGILVMPRAGIWHFTLAPARRSH